MSDGKRRRSASSEVIDLTKRSKSRLEPHAAENTEDDDLEVILARIKEQEESEALARRLQDEWNNVDDAFNASAQTSSAAFVKDSNMDEDEALAIQLSLEELKKNEHAGSVRQDSSRTSQHKNTAQTRQLHEFSDDDSPPDVSLMSHRSLFTGDRPCANCGHLISSPRGFVRFSYYQQARKVLITSSFVHSGYFYC